MANTCLVDVGRLPAYPGSRRAAGNAARHRSRALPGSGGATRYRQRARTRNAVRPGTRLRTLYLDTALMGLFAALAVAAWFGLDPNATVPRQGAGSAVAVRTYVVQPGDTLWSIAARMSGGSDPRPLVARLEQETNGGLIEPGEQLRVP